MSARQKNEKPLQDYWADLFRKLGLSDEGKPHPDEIRI